MKAILVFLMIPLMALPSWAKITVFSSTEAVSFLLSSPEFKSVEAKLSGSRSLKSIIVRKKVVNSLNEFTLTLKYGSDLGSCLISAVVETKLVQVGPRGSITASELAIAELTDPSCTR